MTNIIDKFIKIHNDLGVSPLSLDIDSTNLAIRQYEEELEVKIDSLLKEFWLKQNYIGFGEIEKEEYYTFETPISSREMHNVLCNMPWYSESGTEPVPWDDQNQGLIDFPTHAGYFHELWLPFLDIGNEFGYFIDYNSTNKGQVVVYATQFEDQNTSMYVITKSFEEFITEIVNHYNKKGSLPILADRKRLSIPE